MSDLPSQDLESLNALAEKPTSDIMQDHVHGDGPYRQPARVILFLFATGIENSYPMIQNCRVRRDQMEERCHYRQWQRDFEFLEDLNIRFLRCGPPVHNTLPSAGVSTPRMTSAVGVGSQDRPWMI